MMGRALSRGVMALVVVTGILYAGSGRPVPGAEAPSGVFPKAAMLSSLAWMSGSWGGEQDGTAMEEHWTTPRGDLMLGMHRDVNASGKTSFEFLRIEQRPDGLVYVASPGGAGATEFKAVETAARRIVFENPQHDFPRRILYWGGDDGKLHARVEGPPGPDRRAMEWAWEPLPVAR